MLSVIKLLQKLTTNMTDYFCKTGENSACEIFSRLSITLQFSISLRKRTANFNSLTENI